MRLIFCADPWNISQPDDAFQEEVEAAQAAGLPCSLISFEALTEQNNATRALRRIEALDTQEPALYRGWMLRPEHYAQLYTALAAKNLSLLNSPSAYRFCHHLPENYPTIREHTPLTTWLRTGNKINIDEVMSILQPFGTQAVIVKDFVKSRKHEWFEACYIPSASDREGVERVVKRFVELQGEELNEGLVFREFVEFESLGRHPKSGMPLSKEFRLFFLDGELLSTIAYWGEGAYGDIDVPAQTFEAIAKQIPNRFFTMDIARCVNGTWMIIELGDGQVAGLPERADARAFYQELARRIH